MKAEKMLNLAADSEKMADWNDGLSMIIDSTKSKSKFAALSDDELQLVAGGVNVTDEFKQQLIRSLKIGKK
jgi:hypothetical protein